MIQHHHIATGFQAIQLLNPKYTNRNSSTLSTLQVGTYNERSDSEANEADSCDTSNLPQLLPPTFRFDGEAPQHEEQPENT